MYICTLQYLSIFISLDMGKSFDNISNIKYFGEVGKHGITNITTKNKSWDSFFPDPVFSWNLGSEFKFPMKWIAY